jgi:hypothetical protein
VPALATSRQLLDAVYEHLDYNSGELFPATDKPDVLTSKSWVENGDWLILAKKIGAEKVFFVNNYPVIVFAKQSTNDVSEWVRYFNSVWCMARPQLLFLAREGELTVYNLTRRPAHRDEKREGSEQLLQIVQTAAEVQQKLADYRREQVESGRLFAEARFGGNNRADRALIRDLGRVRQALIDDGLSAGHAHALIGRSIFIRYLEDRGVLTEQYFREVADENKTRWNKILDEDTETAAAIFDGRAIYYPRVLSNKQFTYALFKKLSVTFNGDMFPVEDEEQRAVDAKHLRRLRHLLLGGPTESLFFYAYKFEIIPIESNPINNEMREVITHRPPSLSLYCHRH